VADLIVVRRLERRPVKSTVKITLSFVVGLVVGVIVGGAAANHSWRSYFTFLSDAQQASFTLKAEQQAEAAYFQRSPEIAELELTHLLPFLASPSRILPADASVLPFKQFVAHARLAKVQQAQGKQADADQHFQIALSLMRSFFHASKADSAADVLTLLNTIDDAAKKHQ
jgi:uncharacterized protein (DUF1501 family)